MDGGTPAAPAPPQAGTSGSTPLAAPPGPTTAPPAATGGTGATAPPAPATTGPAGPTSAPPGPDGQIGGHSTLPPDACVSPDAPGSADLIAFELAEHEAWGAATADVGAAASERRADFIADTVGGGMNTGLQTGAATGLVMGFGGAAAGRLAARRIPVPVVGAIIGGAIGAWGLYNTIVNEPDKFTGAVGKIGEGASGYEAAANTTILDANGRPFNADPVPAGPILDAHGRPMTPEGPSSILDPTGTPYGPGNRPSAPDVPAPSPIIDPGTGRPVGSTPPAPLVNPTTRLPVDTLPAPPPGPLIVGPDGRSVRARRPRRAGR